MNNDAHLPDEARIALTVEACIAYATKAERPFQQAADLLIMLKNTPGWTDAEIFEVQGRIVEALLKASAQWQPDSPTPHYNGP
jgi:hypothetical protein